MPTNLKRDRDFDFLVERVLVLEQSLHHINSQHADIFAPVNVQLRNEASAGYVTRNGKLVVTVAPKRIGVSV